MIDHITLHVSNYEQAKNFFLKVLAPVGYTLGMDFPEWKSAGFSGHGKTDFWISEKQPVGNQHVAFSADARMIVDQFYRTAIDAGARDNGAPGIRKDYHPNYYGAFVLDQDGNNIEAVCHKEE